MSDYYRTHFSPQQLKAVNDAIDTYEKGNIKWLILLAQMQSGKTDAFLLIACEMFRHGFIDSIVIFSGNAETELCGQLTKTIQDGDSNYWIKYENFIGDNAIVRNIRLAIKSEYEPKLYVVWGTQKSSYSGPTEKTLFIWEEAHFAQNKDQGPDKFLSNLEISADGSHYHLEKKGNFVLTVSATPFSELSDKRHLSQNKEIIKMEPGEGYTGVGQLKACNRIRKWDTVEQGLIEACSLPRMTKKWAIIRVTDKTKLVESVMEARGWKCENYDSSIPLAARKSGKCTDSGYIAWQKMAAGRAPEEDTVIIIKGMCRMGKNINKDHLLFVFETSKNPATDTILQGLLGRVCGYGNSETIVFLSSKVVNGGEIERYIELWENPYVSIIPRKANNLTEKKVKNTKPIVPIIIDRNSTVSSNGNDANQIRNDVYDALVNQVKRIHNRNPDSYLNEVAEKYVRLFRDNKTKIHVRYLDKDKKTFNKDKADAIRRAYETGIPSDFGSACGTAADGQQVNIWVNKNIEDHRKDIFYITSVVEIDDDERINFLIPKTTKREVFAHHLEDGIELVCNGGMPKLLSPSTATDWTAMCDELIDFVEVSRDSTYFQGIISLGTNEEGQPNGIIVTDKVLKELIDGGRIFKTIQNMGARLKITKSKGPVPKALKDKNLIKLATITWEWINK
jgi:hypothetical protein